MKLAASFQLPGLPSLLRTIEVAGAEGRPAAIGGLKVPLATLGGGFWPAHGPVGSSTMVRGAMLERFPASKNAAKTRAPSVARDLGHVPARTTVVGSAVRLAGS